MPSAPKPEESAGSLTVVSDPPAEYKKAEPEKHVPAAAAPKPGPVPEKPKVFIPNLHGVSNSVKIPSLKEVGKTREAIAEEEDPYLKGDARDAYTSEQFLQCWSNYAARLKADGKKNLLTIFISNPPKPTSAHSYEVIVENKVQENIFRDERPNLLNFLRSALRNFDIEVNVRVDEKAVVKRPYTASEKFQHMAAKNPALVELKNKFNLDFD